MGQVLDSQQRMQDIKDKEQEPISCLRIFTKAQQYHFDPLPPNKNIQIKIETPQQFHSHLRQGIKSQIGFQTLKNPSKYKPKDLTEIKVEVGAYQSEEMKIAKHFSGIEFNDCLDRKEMEFYLHPYYYQLLGLSEEFQEQALEGWKDKLSFVLKLQNILVFQGEFKLETFNDIRSQIQKHLRKTFVVRWEKEKVKPEHLLLMQRQPDLSNSKHYFEKEESKYIYFYTKEESQANTLLKTLTNLQQRVILLDSIFQQQIKCEAFKRTYFPVINEESKSVVVKVQGNEVTVLGQIPDILQYQKLLHIKFATLTVKQLEFQFTLVHCKILNRYIKMLGEFKEYEEMGHRDRDKGKQKGFGKKQVKKEARKVPVMEQVHMFYKRKNDMLGLNLVQIFVYSYSTSKLDKVFYQFMNDLDKVTFKLINIEGYLTSKITNTIKAQYNLDVVRQPGAMIVSGLPDDIHYFQKNFQFHSLPRKQSPTSIKKKRALRTFQKTEVVEYNLFMKKSVAEMFKTEFQKEMDINTTHVEELTIVNIKIVVSGENVKDIQQRIYEFTVKNCSRTTNTNLHSQQHNLIEKLSIDQSIVSELEQWPFGYKLVLEIKKVHNRTYELLYRSCLNQMVQTCVWMEVPLPIETVEEIIQNDLRELGCWERGDIVYKFNSSKAKISKQSYGTVILATTFREVQDTINLKRYQFLIKYVVKVNNVGIKMMVSEQPPGKL